MSLDDDNFKYNFHYVCCTDSNKINDEEYINYNISNLIGYYSRIYNILNETIDESKEIDFSNVEEDLKKKEEIEFENVGLKDEISRLKKDRDVSLHRFFELNENLKKIEKENKELKIECEMLKQDSKRNEKLSDKYTTLESKYNELKEECDKMKNEYDKMKEECDKLKKKNDELLNENADLYSQ